MWKEKTPSNSWVGSQTKEGRTRSGVTVQRHARALSTTGKISGGVLIGGGDPRKGSEVTEGKKL